MMFFKKFLAILPYTFRQIIARTWGNHPWKAEPFDTFNQSHSGYMACAVARPESLTGILREFPRVAPAYQVPLSVRGDKPSVRTETGKPRFVVAGIFPTEPVRVMSFAPGGLIGEEPVAYCPSQRIATAESVRLWTGEAERFPLFAHPRFVHAESRAGIAFSVASVTAEGFYHFMLEGLCRLALVREWWDAFDWVVTNGKPGGFQDRWLAALGWPAAKLLYVHASSHFHFDQLIFTDYLLRDQQPSTWNVDLIRSLFPKPRRLGKRWIWMSREDASNRTLAYESEWLDRFPRFEKVLLSKLTPEEHVALFSEAGVIAGPHGAAFANTVFCPEGCRVLEILPTGFFDPLYARWSSAAGLQHRWLQTDFQSPPNWDEIADSVEHFLNSSADSGA